MSKMNCWEFKKCGRQEGGAKVSEMGICPASSFTKADGFLGGKNAGRGCAYVTGTFCNAAIQGTAKDKEKKCGECEFYAELKKEHGLEVSVASFGKFINR